jgi:hypothetical protein
MNHHYRTVLHLPGDGTASDRKIDGIHSHIPEFYPLLCPFAIPKFSSSFLAFTAFFQLRRYISQFSNSIQPPAIPFYSVTRLWNNAALHR